MDYPFKSDGCTFSPDGFWGWCCFLHDLEYWVGGAWRWRVKSDRDFKLCVENKILSHDWQRINMANKWVARVVSVGAWSISRAYWIGVRIGGLIPFRWSRWGYGFEWPRTGP